MVRWSSSRWVEVRADGTVQVVSALSSVPSFSNPESFMSSFSFAFLNIAVRISSLGARMAEIRLAFAELVTGTGERTDTWGFWLFFSALLLPSNHFSLRFC